MIKIGNKALFFKRLLFFWITSFSIATFGYYLLWLVIPNHYVFAGYYRMNMYHERHPMQYILIPCFFYGIFATLLTKKFKNQTFAKQLLITAIIVILTTLFSSPVGGMLWIIHDMQAGYFPKNWIGTIIKVGTAWGLELGWFIVFFSIPYAYLGVIICFFLTRYGAKIFTEKETGITAS